MPSLLRFCLALWLAWVVAADTARAQVFIPDSDCASFCLRAPGAYVLTGLSMWPTATGLAFTAGAFHNRLFGVEVGAWVPIGGTPDQEGVLGSMIAGRVTLLRTSLGQAQTLTPSSGVSLVLSFRAGFAMLFNDSEPLAALGLGPAADLVLFDMFIVTLRPLLAVRPTGDVPDGAAPFRAFPLVELSVGMLASDGCTSGVCLP